MRKNENCVTTALIGARIPEQISDCLGCLKNLDFSLFRPASRLSVVGPHSAPTQSMRRRRGPQAGSRDVLECLRVLGTSLIIPKTILKKSITDLIRIPNWEFESTDEMLMGVFWVRNIGI